MSQTLRAADLQPGKERKVAQKTGQRRGYRYKITIPSLKDRGNATYRMVQVEAPLELDQALLLECVTLRSPRTMPSHFLSWPNFPMAVHISIRRISW